MILRVALLLSSTQAPSAPGSVGQSGSVCSGAMLSSTMCASSGRVNLDVNATGIRVASSPTPGAPGSTMTMGSGSNVVQHIGHGGRRSVVSQLVLVRQDEVVRCAGHQIRRRVDGLYVGHAARQLRQGHKIVDGARRGLGKDDHAVAVPVLAGVERPDREGQRAGQGILLTRKRVHEVKIGGEPFVCLGVCDHRRLCQDVVLPDGFVLTLHRGEGSTDPRELRCDRHHEPVGGRVLDVECG